MQIAATPSDEAQRLESLYAYEVLDTEPERSFDDLTELLSVILDVPIVLISLVDDTRQWFKSHHGLGAQETPREYAFCAHAIHDDDLLIVQDSRLDERFADNPLVAGEPHVIFYAGKPLVTPDGYRIGTVCGIDHNPRELNDQQMRALEIASHQIIEQLELRKVRLENDRIFRRQSELLRSLESANSEMRELTSVIAHDLRAPIVNIAGFCHMLDEDLEEKLGAMMDTDSERTESFVTSVRGTVGKIQTAAERLAERIDAVGKLSRYSIAEHDSEVVELTTMLDSICENHENELNNCNGRIEYGALPNIVGNRLRIHIVLENLIENAVKYRSQSRELRVTVACTRNDGRLHLSVSDNGRGFKPEEAQAVFVMFRRVGRPGISGNGTGLAYCRAIVSRMGGSIWCESSPDEGTTFHLELDENAVLPEQVAAYAEARES